MALLVERVANAEGDGQEGAACEVAHGREVGDGRVIGIDTAKPQPEHQALGDEEEEADLNDAGLKSEN